MRDAYEPFKAIADLPLILPESFNSTLTFLKNMQLGSNELNCAKK